MPLAAAGQAASRAPHHCVQFQFQLSFKTAYDRHHLSQRNSFGHLLCAPPRYNTPPSVLINHLPDNSGHLLSRLPTYYLQRQTVATPAQHSPAQRIRMEQSPLTQQPRPEAFQAKIVQLYQELFKVCHLQVLGVLPVAVRLNGNWSKEGIS